MQNDHQSISIVIPETLSSLDKAQLIDLLQHETHLLVTATQAKVTDKDYIQDQRKKVEQLQAEIKSRIE